MLAESETNMKMVVIDGSSGEGGGQILRTALAVSMVTGRPFRIKDIREKRKKPGLLQSHVAMIKAAARLCSAGFDGAALGSGELTFFPGDVVAGDHSFRLPSTVSAGLVLQTMLPVLSLAKGDSSVVVEGGGSRSGAPPFEFLVKTYLPQISKMGPKATLKSEVTPDTQIGVSRFKMTVESALIFRPVSLVERGVPMHKSAMRTVTGLAGHRAGDEVDELERTIGMASESMRSEKNARAGSVMLEMTYEGITEVFTAFAKAGQSSESLAADAAKQAKRYMESQAAVCEYLGDQLLLPMALAGSGRFTTTRVSPHARSNMDTIRAFLGVEFWTEPVGDGTWLVEVKRTPV